MATCHHFQEYDPAEGHVDSRLARECSYTVLPEMY